MILLRVFDKYNQEELTTKPLETNEKQQEKDKIKTGLEKDPFNYEMQQLTARLKKKNC